MPDPCEITGGGDEAAWNEAVARPVVLRRLTLVAIRDLFGEEIAALDGARARTDWLFRRAAFPPAPIRPSRPAGRVHAHFRAVAAERASAGARGAGPPGLTCPADLKDPGANLINPAPAGLRHPTRNLTTST
jgi:hypothetical protein